MALDTTLGGDETDSYVSLADADTYFANHYHTAKATAWAALSDAQKEQVLRAAANIIDTLSFTDSLVDRAYWNQARIFPRNIDYDDEYYVPPQVLDAQCEQAIFLMSVDETAMAQQMAGFESELVQAGSVKTFIKYKPGVAGGHSMVAPLAFELVRQLIRRSQQRYRA